MQPSSREIFLVAVPGCSCLATSVLVKIHAGFCNCSRAANTGLLLPSVPKQWFPRGLAKCNPFGAIIQGCWGCSNQQIFYPNSKLVFQKDLRKFWWLNWCTTPFQLGISSMKQMYDVKPQRCWEGFLLLGRGTPNLVFASCFH